MAISESDSRESVFWEDANEDNPSAVTPSRSSNRRDFKGGRATKVVSSNDIPGKPEICKLLSDGRKWNTFSKNSLSMVQPGLQCRNNVCRLDQFW